MADMRVEEMIAVLKGAGAGDEATLDQVNKLVDSEAIKRSMQEVLEKHEIERKNALPSHSEGYGAPTRGKKFNLERTIAQVGSGSLRDGFEKTVLTAGGYSGERGFYLPSKETYQRGLEAGTSQAFLPETLEYVGFQPLLTSVFDGLNVTRRRSARGKVIRVVFPDGIQNSETLAENQTASDTGLRPSEVELRSHTESVSTFFTDEFEWQGGEEIIADVLPTLYDDLSHNINQTRFIGKGMLGDPSRIKGLLDYRDPNNTEDLNSGEITGAQLATIIAATKRKNLRARELVLFLSPELAAVLAQTPRAGGGNGMVLQNGAVAPGVTVVETAFMPTDGTLSAAFLVDPRTIVLADWGETRFEPLRKPDVRQDWLYVSQSVGHTLYAPGRATFIINVAV